MSSPLEYPPELLSLICAYVYVASIPTRVSSLDPLCLLEAGMPTGLPSSYPPSSWSEPVARKTLVNLTLVNRAWSEAARPWLWRKIEVRLPRGWLSLVEEISGGEDADAAEEDTARTVEESITEAAHAAMAAKTGLTAPDVEAEKRLKESIILELGGPDSSIPPELLSPPASRDPSPRRLRQKSKSPARWKLLRCISDVVQGLMGVDQNGMYVPAIHDRRPGRFVRHLDFNHFRTIGMRRLVGEGLNNRFVTGERLEAMLKETPNLTTFGATEYMDGALTLSVLKELLLRGTPSRGRGQPLRGRGLVVEDASEEAEDRARRRECKELEAIDVTGCVSVVFVSALTDFVNTHMVPPAPTISDSDSGEDGDHRGHRRSRSSRLVAEEPVTFPGLQRLSVRGAKSIPPQILNTFITAFPSLTHLDLSSTRASPDILDGLAASPTVRLQSLSLARCVRLTGSSIRKFLVSAPAASGITELNLYGDNIFPLPMSAEELREVFTRAPCFTSGELVYLDISSAPVDQELLDAMPAQAKLRSLGLSFIPNLPLGVVAEFIRNKAAQIEVLTLLGTSPELVRVQPRQASVALHGQIIRPLCTAPLRLNVTSDTPAPQIPTRLRVIELTTALLSALGTGAGAWRIVRSKGGRGWYVDTSSGWVASQGGALLRRDLERGHPWRRALEILAEANGNVSSGIGWHARKMEVLHGHGLLGREDGLYGAVSFAYQG